MNEGVGTSGGIENILQCLVKFLLSLFFVKLFKNLSALLFFRARFSPLQTEREAANYMLKVIRDSHLNVR